MHPFVVVAILALAGALIGLAMLTAQDIRRMDLEMADADRQLADEENGFDPKERGFRE